MSKDKFVQESYDNLETLERLRDKLSKEAGYKQTKESQALIWAIATLIVSNPFCKDYEYLGGR